MSVVTPRASSRSTVGPDAAQQPGRGRGEPPQASSRLSTTKVQLSGVRRHLRHQLARPDAHRAAEPGALADGRSLSALRWPAGARSRRGPRTPRPAPPPPPPGSARAGSSSPCASARSVEVEVGRQEHRLAGTAAGPTPRAGRPDPVAARLVARGGHHARSSSPQTTGQATQPGPLQLHADVERVHVETCVDVGPAVGHGFGRRSRPVRQRWWRISRSVVALRAGRRWSSCCRANSVPASTR